MRILAVSLLYVINITTTPEFIQNMLTEAKDIETLELYNVKTTSPWLDKSWAEESHDSLKKINVFTVKRTPIDEATIKIILSKAIKIKKIKLDFNDRWQGMLDKSWLIKNPKFTKRWHEIELDKFFLSDCAKQYLGIEFTPKTIKSIHATHENKETSKALKKEIRTLAAEPNASNKKTKTSSNTTHYTHSSIETFVGDCDTTFNKIKDLPIKMMFYSSYGKEAITPSSYRLNAYTELEFLDITDASKSPFLLTNQQDYKFKAVDIPCIKKNSFQYLKDIEKTKPSNNYYYTKIEITISTKWQSLLSATPLDKIICLHIDGIDKESIDIKYSKRDDLYYIRAKHDSTNSFYLDYIIETPKNKTASIPKEILAITSKYQEFSHGKINITKGVQTNGEKIIQQIIEKKVGACRHRAIACMYEINKQFPNIQTRVVHNECHAFIEVKSDNKWLAIDLGGYQGNLIKNNEFQPTKPKQRKAPKQLNLAVITSVTLDDLNPAFITWIPKVEYPSSIFQYIKDLLNAKPANTLVNLNSKAEIRAFNLLLQKYCFNKKIPVFYINQPDDIICSARWIECLDDNTGVMRKGPGGRLYNFLTQEHKKAVLIINWDNFSTKEIIQHNSLIDKARKADGTEIKPYVKIIGLFNPNKPNSYIGSDFHSRFDNKSSTNITTEEYLKQSHSLRHYLKTDVPSAAKTDIKIELYNSSNWEQILLGTWTLHGSKFVFEEGELIKAFKRQDRTIQLNNAPINDQSFNLFWQQAFIHRKIKVNQTEISVPDNLSVFNTNEHHYNNNITWVKSESLPYDCQIYALNPGTVGQYIGRYLYKENKIYKIPGLFEELAGSAITMQMTRDLNEDAWDQLLSMAFSKKVQLKVIPAPNMKIPNWLPEINVENTSNIIEFQNIAKKSSQVIITNDTDYSVSNLKAKLQDIKVTIIDISEIESTEVLANLTAKLNADKISFKLTTGVILNKLANGETIILTGKFKPELVDSISSICFQNSYIMTNNVKQINSGKLYIVTEHASFFGFTRNFKQDVSFDDKLNLLKNKFSGEIIEKLKTQLKGHKNHTYIQLQAMAAYIENSPEANIYNLWNGLDRISRTNNKADFDIKLTLDSYQSFLTARINKIAKALLYSPYVFISGVTGVGKSTFIQTQVAKLTGYTVFVGMSSLKLWAKSNSDNYIVLFIDEANLDNYDYSIFEGLYQKPPNIVIKGKLYNLTEKHKVIFAGNPLSYGGERHMPSLFARHGNSIVFEPLNASYIYHQILKPVFANFIPIAKQKENSIALLKVYKYICLISKAEILITPRELQMMAMLISAKAYNSISAAYNIAKNVLSKEQLKNFNKWFNNEFGLLPSIPKMVLLKDEAKTEFIMTESKIKLNNIVSSILHVREFKKNGTNPQQCYGGLSGAIIEGEPGIGKSHYLIYILKKYGFIEGNISIKNKHPNVFHVIPVGMSPTEKKELLLKAFKYGQIVIIDEINSCSMMERLLNAILMGYDLKSSRPKVPGFTLFGTQNPISMAGRHATSVAISRRLLKHCLPGYTKKEMKQILTSYGYSKSKTKKAISDYYLARTYAKNNQKIPAPNFRDLLKYMAK